MINNIGLEYEIIDHNEELNLYDIKFKETGNIYTVTYDNLNNNDVRDRKIQKPRVIEGDIFKSNNYGYVIVVQKINPDLYEVEFMNTGYRKYVSRRCLNNGEMRDDSIYEYKVQVNCVYYNTHNLPFIVTRKINNNYFEVVFIKSGFITIVHFKQIRECNIKDRLSPTVCGVGMMGYISKPAYTKQEYKLWVCMLDRCYNENKDNYYLYGGRGVTVCERWKRFDYFVHDIRNLEGYDRELFEKKKIKLDKDLKQFNKPYNQRVYSPETCIFVSSQLNSRLTPNSKYTTVYNNIVYYKGDEIYRSSPVIPGYIKPAILTKPYIIPAIINNRG